MNINDIGKAAELERRVRPARASRAIRSVAFDGEKRHFNLN